MLHRCNIHVNIAIQALHALPVQGNQEYTAADTTGQGLEHV